MGGSNDIPHIANNPNEQNLDFNIINTFAADGPYTGHAVARPDGG